MSNSDIIELLDEGKIKRYFRVNKKLIVKYGVYHITQRAPGLEKVFIEESDYLYFLKNLKEAVSKFKLNLFAFVLMPNHFHLLLRIEYENLPEAMKWVLGKYAIFFNKKYRRKGHVFGGRYRAALCNDDSYLLAISLYIHLNPYKANLSKTVGEYRWSSVIPYIRSFKKTTFLNYEFILKMLDGDLAKARDSYAALLAESSEVRFPNILEKPNAMSKFVRGVSGFIKNIDCKAGREIMQFEELLKQLRSKKRLNTPRERKARIYVISQLRARGYKVSEICELLGVSRQTVFKFTK